MAAVETSLTSRSHEQDVAIRRYVQNKDGLWTEINTLNDEIKTQSNSTSRLPTPTGVITSLPSYCMTGPIMLKIVANLMNEDYQTSTSKLFKEPSSCDAICHDMLNCPYKHDF